MALGKSIRIYLADGGVTGIRHGEIVNWTGQAIACPRTRFPELKEWAEAKRPGVYFLFGKNDESGQDAVYIGEAEVVLDRLHSHISGKNFWTELVAFTSKDDNLTKAHVRYLESRLVTLASDAERYTIENSTCPQLPSLPRADRDAMEEFMGGVQTLLGVLGHRVLEPLIEHAAVITPYKSNSPSQTTAQVSPELPTHSPVTPLQQQVFHLNTKNLTATAVRTDEGLVVLKNSEAAQEIKNSLPAGSRTLRENLISSGTLVTEGETFKFTKDHLFSSPSQAAAVIVGYSISGPEHWKTPSGMSFANFEKNESL